MVVDLGALAQVERTFGGAAFRTLRDQVDPLLEELHDQFRRDDTSPATRPRCDRFLLFLAGPRRREHGFRVDDLRQLVDRVEEFLGPAHRPPDPPVPARAADPRRRLRHRPVDPAREPRAADPSPRRRRDRLRRAARARARARRARAPPRDRPEPRDLDRLPADRGPRDRARPWAGRASLAARAAPTSSADRAVLARRALRHHRGARAGLPAAGLRRLAAAEDAGPAVRQHRARHGARHHLPGPRRPRLPRARPLAERRHARDHRAAGDREPQPLPRGDARPSPTSASRSRSTTWGPATRASRRWPP